MARRGAEARTAAPPRPRSSSGSMVSGYSGRLSARGSAQPACASTRDLDIAVILATNHAEGTGAHPIRSLDAGDLAPQARPSSSGLSDKPAPSTTRRPLSGAIGRRLFRWQSLVYRNPRRGRVRVPPRRSPGGRTCAKRAGRVRGDAYLETVQAFTPATGEYPSSSTSRPANSSPPSTSPGAMRPSSPPSRRAGRSGGI